MQTQDRPFDNIDGGSQLHSIPQVMNQPNTTVGIMVIDASSSMKRHGQAPARAVNEAVDLIRQASLADGRTYHIGIVSFADKMTVLQQVRPVSEVGQVRGYHAEGNTRLYGTVYDVIAYLIREARACGQLRARDLRVIVGVFSDGDDNQSKDYHQVLLDTSKIAYYAGWKLQSVGIGIDSVRLAALLGFDPSLAVTVEATEEGMTSGTTGVANTMTDGYFPRPIPPTHTDGGIRTDP